MSSSSGLRTELPRARRGIVVVLALLFLTASLLAARYLSAPYYALRLMLGSGEEATARHELDGLLA